MPTEKSARLRYRQGSAMPTMGAKPKSLNAAEMLERLPHLAGLVLQLHAVVEVLPHAAPASAERRAAGRAAVGRGSDDLLHPGLGVALLVLGHPGAHDVAGDGAGHEDHEVVDPGDALAPEGKAGDGQFDDLVLLELGGRRGHGASIRSRWPAQVAQRPVAIEEAIVRRTRRSARRSRPKDRQVATPTFSNTSSRFRSSTRMVSPSRNSPLSSASATWSWISFWMSRLSGRAP